MLFPRTQQMRKHFASIQAGGAGATAAHAASQCCELVSELLSEAEKSFTCCAIAHNKCTFASVHTAEEGAIPADVCQPMSRTRRQLTCSESSSPTGESQSCSGNLPERPESVQRRASWQQQSCRPLNRLDQRSGSKLRNFLQAIRLFLLLLPAHRSHCNAST